MDRYRLCSSGADFSPDWICFNGFDSAAGVEDGEQADNSAGTSKEIIIKRMPLVFKGIHPF